MELNRQARMKRDSPLNVWVDWGNVTFEQAAVMHCQEIRQRIGLCRHETFVIETRCTSAPNTTFIVEVEFNDEPSRVTMKR